MKLKNLLPYYIAHQFFEYNSKYMEWITKGYDEQIKKSLLEKDYLMNELEMIYYMSINHKRTNIINFFEEKQIPVNKTKKVFVYEAAKMNYPALVNNYLLTNKPKIKNKFLLLLLKIATLHNSKEVVEVLLKYKVDFTQDNYYCIRELLSANNFDLFKLFHEYGLDIKKQQYLFKAILNDNYEWFIYILNNGFEINEQNKEIIYNLIGFNASINILEQEKSLFIRQKELMLTSSRYNPLSKQWFENFYKKVDFYNKIENRLPAKENTSIKKVVKI